MSSAPGYAPEAERERAEREFYDAFAGRMTADLLEVDDVVTLTMTAAARFQADDLAVVQRAVDLLSPFRQAAAEISPPFYLVFVSLEMRLHEVRGRKEAARASANEILDRYEKVVSDRADVANDMGPLLQGLRQAARQLLARTSEWVLPSKIGRNARVVVRHNVTGRESRTKYKFVEADVRAGRMTVLDVQDRG